MANDILIKVNHIEYVRLLEKCRYLEKDNAAKEKEIASLKAALEKVSAKKEDAKETKKGGK